jgi:hypothetical protein
MVLTMPTGLLFLGQWHNTWEVTYSTAWECKSLIFAMTLWKPCEDETNATGCCQKIMTPQWNKCASFYVVATVIQIMSMTQGTSLLEQPSLSFHYHICCFISRSEVKFLCGTIDLELWHSYVVPVFPWKISIGRTLIHGYVLWVASHGAFVFVWDLQVVFCVWDKDPSTDHSVHASYMICGTC